MTSATPTKTPRRSLLSRPPRLSSNNNSSISTISTPNLNASFAGRTPQAPAGTNAREAGFRRKASHDQLSLGSPSRATDTGAGYALATVEDEDLTPTRDSMAPSTPGLRRMASGAVGNGTADSTGGEIEVGDAVDVPGGMWGTVKFVGGVGGKKGVFAGVELAREFAARGKNDGEVDG